MFFESIETVQTNNHLQYRELFYKYEIIKWYSMLNWQCIKSHMQKNNSI